MTAVRLIVWIGARNVMVKAAVRAVIAVRVIVAVRTIVGVCARAIAAGIVRSPGMVAVIIRVVPGPVVDVSVVVVDDRSTATPATPVHIPCVPAPTASSTPSAAKRGPNRDATSEVETNRGDGHWRWHVKRHHYRDSVHHGGVVLRNIDHLRVRRLNHYRGRTLLLHCDLRRGL